MNFETACHFAHILINAPVYFSAFIAFIVISVLVLFSVSIVETGNSVYLARRKLGRKKR